MVGIGKEERAGGDPKTKANMANVEEGGVEKRDPVKSYSQKFWDIVQGGWKWTSVARHNAVVLLQQPKPEKREKWIIFGSTLYTEGKSGEYTAQELLFDRISPDPSNRLVYVRTVDWKPFIANPIPCSSINLHFETRADQVRVLEAIRAAYAEPKPTSWSMSEEDAELKREHERELAEKLDDVEAQNPAGQPTSRCHTLMPLVAISGIADVYERWVDSEHSRRVVEDWPEVVVMKNCALRLFKKGAGECCPPSQITI
ncbi:unnamed protein product, partial [Mesorhabditis spiculigera]